MDTEDRTPQDLEGQEAEGAEAHDPRPVFEGDWGSASGKERQAHLVKVNAWKRRNGLYGTGEGAPASRGKGADAEVAAILGSAPTDTPLDSRALRVLREIANDKSAPASARVTAANALRVEESASSAVAADLERDRVTQALSTVPLHERLLLLERIVRRGEPRGWQSVFAQVHEEAAPSAPSAAPAV